MKLVRHCHYCYQKRWRDVRGGNGGREEEEERIVRRKNKVMIDQKQVRKSVYRRGREVVGGRRESVAKQLKT